MPSIPSPATQSNVSAVRDPAGLLVAVDVGSARVACAVAEVGTRRPIVIAAETATSYGIRGGEIVDIHRASESIRIAIEAAAERADAVVRTVVVGLSGEVKLTTAKAALELDKDRRVVTAAEVAQLRRFIGTEAGQGRRIIHRFDGPYTVGDLNGVEHPEGLSGDRLEMNASFLSASGDRLDNVLKAVRAAGVEIEAVSLEPMSCSLGSLSPDERSLGAAVIDLGAGAFRGALWEGGRLRQTHVAGREVVLHTKSGRALAGTSAPIGGMEGISMAVARRFRIAPATAERLLKSHAALDDAEFPSLPAFADVAAVDGLGSVRVETQELSRTIEELLAPIIRSMRDGLSGFSVGHSVGIVLVGGGARIRGISGWVSKRFGGVPVRLGVPRWEVADTSKSPGDLLGCSGCSLAGLLALGAEGRQRVAARKGTSLFGKIGDGIRRLTASF